MEIKIQCDNGETYLRTCFVGSVSDENTKLKLDTGIERTVWYSEEDIRKHKRLRSPLVLKSIDDYLLGYKYPLSLVQDLET